MKVDYNSVVLREIINIKRRYCKKCVYFQDFTCTKNKLIKKCFKNNERVKSEHSNSNQQIALGSQH